jgi:hypothetical protein
MSRVAWTVRAGVHPFVDLAGETHEVPRPMLLLGVRYDHAGRDVERREEIHRAMANVVVRLAFGPTQVHRQNRLCALKRLNLRLFVEGQGYGVVGWVQLGHGATDLGLVNRRPAR